MRAGAFGQRLDADRRMLRIVADGTDHARGEQGEQQQQPGGEETIPGGVDGLHPWSGRHGASERKRFGVAVIARKQRQ